MKPSEWADRYFRLRGQSSSQKGRWRTLAYQREPMDLIGRVPRVTFAKSKRVGYTKGLIVAHIGYRIHLDPCSMIVMMPTRQDAEEFSKEEIAPMIAETPALRAIVAEAKEKSSGNTLLHKEFAGHVLHLVGANSARGVRRIGGEIAFADEVDDLPASVGGSEGDPIKLLQGRLGDALNPCLVDGSTPRVKGASRIWKSWEQSDQRRFVVPCPHCDAGQYLKWGGGDDFDYGIKWPTGKPEEAYYLCEHCHCEIAYRERARMVEQGIYEATREEGLWPGYHIWAAYSPLPSAAWGAMAAEFLETKGDPAQFQTFVNTVLGEPWEPGEAPKDKQMMRRREQFPVLAIPGATEQEAPREVVLVPRPVAVLTAFVDVQRGGERERPRLEAGLQGWGYGEETWHLEHMVFYGDPEGRAVWEELWQWILRPRLCERGGVDYIRATGIDSGWAPQAVYEFVAPRQRYETPGMQFAKNDPGCFVLATKGVHVEGRKVWATSSIDKASRCTLWGINVDVAKDVVAARARQVAEPGPGYVHVSSQFGPEWFRQFESEYTETKYDSANFAKRVWKLRPGRKRNETWDCAVGNYGVLCGLRELIGLDLDAMAARIHERFIAAPEGMQAPEHSPIPVLAQEQMPVAPPPAAERSPADEWLDRRRDDFYRDPRGGQDNWLTRW